MTEIHGHRGARALRPENTLPGLAHALAIGVDALEFDVTLTADGGLILAHDLVVNARTILDTGPARPGDPAFPYVGRRWLDLSRDQVATLDAGQPPASSDGAFVPVPSTGVPTLDQVCRLVTEAGASQVTLSVELKTDPSWPDRDVRQLAESALDALAARGLTSRARILGFDWRVLRAAQAADSEVPRVALIEPTTWVPGSAWLAGIDPATYQGSDGDATGPAAAAREIGAAWLSPWEPMVGPDLVAAAHQQGLGVIAWTANSADRMTELVALGADGIVTDRPDRLREVLAARGDPLPVPCVLPWSSGLPDWAPRARP
jgi:glycerophosphoryl diester phosphodiesterase